MDLPFWGYSLQNAMDIFSAAAPPGGQGNIGAFEVSMAAVTGAAIATTTAPMLVNPAGSGKLLRILGVMWGDESGTIICAHLRYYRGNVPTNVLSGITDGSSGIQARTRYVASVAKWYTAVTSTPAASVFMPVGIGSGGAIAAQFYWLQDICNGRIVVQPGEFWYPFASNAAIAMVATVGVQWIETPIALGN